MVSRMERSPIDWKEMIVSHVSGKGLVSKIRKERLQLNKQVSTKQAKDLDRYFVKEDTKWEINSGKHGWGHSSSGKCTF